MAHFSLERKTALSAPIPRLCLCKACGISAPIACAPRANCHHTCHPVPRRHLSSRGLTAGTRGVSAFASLYAWIPRSSRGMTVPEGPLRQEVCAGPEPKIKSFRILTNFQILVDISRALRYCVRKNKKRIFIKYMPYDK